jgi:hypothetical protein
LLLLEKEYYHKIGICARDLKLNALNALRLAPKLIAHKIKNKKSPVKKDISFTYEHMSL